MSEDAETPLNRRLAVTAQASVLRALLYDGRDGVQRMSGEQSGASASGPENDPATGSPGQEGMSGPAILAAPQLPLVTARRCDGRVATILGKHATAADPWFFTAGDGTTYVVKVASTHDRTAFNEAFFGRLARHVNLRVPEVVVIDVPADLVADDPQLSAINYPPGLHVGVARLPNGSFDLRGGVLKQFGTKLRLENECELPGTVVFSSWVEDHDHAGNDGNWMLEPREDDKYIMWMIDFGHALTGPNWQAAALVRLGNPETVRRQQPHHAVAPACREGTFEPTLERVDAMAIEELAALAKSVPAEWLPVADERTKAATMLAARRPGLGTAYRGSP
jgi:hypothetical protein